MNNILKRKVSRKVSAIVLSSALIGALSVEAVVVHAANEEYAQIFASASTTYATGSNVQKTSKADSAISEADAIRTVRDQIAARTTDIHITFVADQDFKSATQGVDPNTSEGQTKLLAALGEKVYAHTGDVGTGDELRRIISGGNRSVTLTEEGDDLYVDVDLTNLQYTTSAVQETEYRAKLSEVLASLPLTGMNDFNKLKTIYQYICKNVTYDTEHVSDTSYGLQYTGYGALMKGTAVCEGYASLLYRMCLMEGIDCRMIFGTADTEGGRVYHAWNIVRVDGMYYECDATWDAGSDGAFEWFLIGSDHFSRHNPDAEYTAAAFKAQYPISTADDPVVQSGTAAESGTTGASSSGTSFTDVKTSAYYYTPVTWAVGKSIVSGTSAATFGSNDQETRGGLVDSLYRLYGSPAVLGTSVFEDAQSGSYKDAITWAADEKIASGTSATKFSPDSSLTRAQAVTYFWRAAGSPAVSSTAAFADVDAGAYYAKAIAWAFTQGITTGTDATHFSPNAPLTRAQTVTFLYKFAQAEGLQ